MKIEDNKDLSSWLNKGLKYLYDEDAVSVALLATLKNGEIFSGYFNCDVPSKLLYSGYINQDAMLDTLAANSDEPYLE